MANRPHAYDRIPLALIGLLAAFLAIGLAAARFGPAGPSATDTLPDLSTAQLVEVRDASGRTVLSGEFRERVDALGNIEKDAALVERGGRHVIGEIEIGIPGPTAMMSGQELDIDIIELRPKSYEMTPFVIARAMAGERTVPAWLEVMPSKMRILVHGLPARQVIDTPVQEQLIVELYSK